MSLIRAVSACTAGAPPLRAVCSRPRRYGLDDPALIAAASPVRRHPLCAGHHGGPFQIEIAGGALSIPILWD
jgi:hypothetical protein